MTLIKLLKTFLLEYKLCVLLLMTLSILWRLGFLHSIENDWKQFLFEHNDGISEVPEKKWENSPLWVEDQKPHINPHKYRYWIEKFPYLIIYANRIMVLKEFSLIFTFFQISD